MQRSHRALGDRESRRGVIDSQNRFPPHLVDPSDNPASGNLQNVFSGEFPEGQRQALRATGKHIPNSDYLFTFATFRDVESFAVRILSCFHDFLLR